MRPAAYAGILAGLNLYFCHELFRTEFFDNLQSNEGALASLGRFFARHPGARWFSLWNIGMPAENTYSPLAPAAVAALSSATGISAPLALHIVAGLFFCLAPLTWFWTARKWGVRAECALAGGLLYTLLSPTSLLFPVLRSDLAHRTDSRRMMDLVYYGDIAHLVALALLPLALVALDRALRTVRPRACLAAVVLCGMTALSNAFGITTLALGSLALVAALETRDMRRALGPPGPSGRGDLPVRLAPPDAPPAGADLPQLPNGGRRLPLLDPHAAGIRHSAGRPGGHPRGGPAGAHLQPASCWDSPGSSAAFPCSTTRSTSSPCRRCCATTWRSIWGSAC